MKSTKSRSSNKSSSAKGKRYIFEKDSSSKGDSNGNGARQFGCDFNDVARKSLFQINNEQRTSTLLNFEDQTKNLTARIQKSRTNANSFI